MLEKDFGQIAEKTLDKLADALDSFDEAGDLELEYQNGILNITLNSGKQFIINKHAPSQQIWLSSPISGGLHFSYDFAVNKWKLTDGKSINEILSAELKKLANIEVVL
jgi:iron donor protein CyaY